MNTVKHLAAKESDTSIGVEVSDKVGRDRMKRRLNIGLGIVRWL